MPQIGSERFLRPRTSVWGMGPGLPDGHREKPAVASKIARFFRVWAGRLTARAAPSNNSEQQTRHVQVSKDSFHSEPSTQDKADNRPLNRPHSKSSQPRFSRPYFSSIRAAAAGDDLPEHESQELTPHHVVLLAERDHAVWRSLARLRPSDQALLRLLVADPRPAYEEISAALGMPIGSIGPTRARALERLRKELERESALSLTID